MLPWALGIFVAAFLLIADRDSRHALGWSALWGATAGVWFLAPHLLQVQRIAAEGPGPWLTLDAFIVILFGSIGGILGLLSTVPWAVRRLVIRRGSRVPLWHSAFWPALCLPPLYLVASAAIQWANYGGLGSPPNVPVLLLVFAAMALVTLIAAVIFINSRHLELELTSFRIARPLIAMLCLGLAVLPARVPRRTYSAAGVEPLRASSRVRSRPLLFVGIDGATWRVIQPLIDRGEAPTLARVVRSGITGDMRAEWPPYWSAPAWAAMLTGYGEAETGVHEDLLARVPGLPAFELFLSFDPWLNPVYAVEYELLRIGVMTSEQASRDDLKRPPIWERLSAANRKVAVVRMPFTYPAGGTDVMISNRVVTDLWDLLGVKTGDREALVWPREITDRSLAFFDVSTSVDETLLRRFVPRPDWPQPRDTWVNPVDVLRRVLRIQSQVQDTTLDIVKSRPDLSAVMLYVAGFDNLAHVFWPYRFPEDYPTGAPTAADVAALGPVLDEYVRWTDEQLAALIAAFPEEPNVLIVSDHGSGASDGTAALWRGAHDPRGVFLMAGPDVSVAASGVVAEYFDVVPTLLDLMNIEKPPALSGGSQLLRKPGSPHAAPPMREKVH